MSEVLRGGAVDMVIACEVVYNNDAFSSLIHTLCHLIGTTRLSPRRWTLARRRWAGSSAWAPHLSVAGVHPPAGPRTRGVLALRKRHGCDVDLFLEMLARHFTVTSTALHDSAHGVDTADTSVSRVKHLPQLYQLSPLQAVAL